MTWPPLLRRAALVFGIAPRDFWQLSLKEWRALTQVEQGPEPLSRAAFEALAAAHPDQAAGDAP